ncbi:MAG: 50S ribosomal protein L18 [Saprospiraceae bacterium]
MKLTKKQRRKRIHWRIRNKITGTAIRPRLSVFRSNKAIYVQLVDDKLGHTLCSASSKDAGMDASKNKTEQAAQVGKTIGEKATALGLERAVFDRSGYLYHGRVKALADGAREGGLKF